MNGIYRTYELEHYMSQELASDLSHRPEPNWSLRRLIPLLSGVGVGIGIGIGVGISVGIVVGLVLGVVALAVPSNLTLWVGLGSGFCIGVPVGVSIPLRRLRRRQQQA